MTDSKNPKDAMGLKKPQLGLMPAAGVIYGAMAMQDGARKYGAYNWRKKSVIATIYLDAIERHLKSFRDGEWNDPSTPTVPHLGNIIACAAILADAIELGVLVDDRPPAGPAAAVLARFSAKSQLSKTGPVPYKVGDVVTMGGHSFEMKRAAGGRRAKKKPAG